jgi:hypothetical protein
MRPLAIIILCAGICACNTPIDAPMSPTFGEAKASMNEHVIAQGPPSELPPTSSGVRAAAAIERYLRGDPKAPQAQSTSDVKVSLAPNASSSGPVPAAPASSGSSY